MQVFFYNNFLKERLPLKPYISHGNSYFAMREIEQKLISFFKEKIGRGDQDVLRRSIVVHSTGRTGLHAGQFSEMLKGDRPFYFDYVCQLLRLLDVAIYLDGENLYELEKNYDHLKVLRERDFYKSKYDLMQEIIADNAKKNSSHHKKKVV